MPCKKDVTPRVGTIQIAGEKAAAVVTAEASLGAAGIETPAKVGAETCF
ncbi:MAG: hypothetical protein JOZ39_09080 [Chloroflexi bacterium]|nr:hypothetical protein [Chloroflexota bacterium]